jgi:site-specific DNA-methyltransferase (adenine-specific)
MIAGYKDKHEYTNKHGFTSTVYLMDCMEGMNQFNENHFDLAVVDPPYRIGRNKMNMGNSIFNKDNKSWDDNIPNEKYFEDIFMYSKNQIIWGGNYFPLPQSQYFAIWDKGETMYGRDFAECEYAWIRSGGTRIFKKTPNQIDRIHPTQKPTALYDWIYANYLPEGGKVINSHLGSGSNRIAADKAAKIHFTGFEIDEEYFYASVRRFEQYTSQLTLF